MNKNFLILGFFLILAILIGCTRGTQNRPQGMTENNVASEDVGLGNDLNALNDTDTSYDDLNNLDSDLNETQNLNI